MNKIIIDYFAFSVRIDDKSSKFDGKLDKQFIFNLLGIHESEFSNLGKCPYYEEMYKCNDITVKVPFEGREVRQGFHISMSGNGCRYFESIQKDGEFINAMDIWRNFFIKVRGLNDKGLSVNITRFDNAVDDFEGLLNLDEIERCMVNREYSSRFRTPSVEGSGGLVYVKDSGYNFNYSHALHGRTYYFGSRKSESFVRFYDKKIEQLQRHFNDEEKREELEKINHWVRMEFEFKDDTAIKMVNAFCDSENYSKFFSKYVNGMLRFVDRDDSNISRCTVKGWWQKFIGTLERLSLAVGEYKPVSLKKCLDYVYGSLFGPVMVAMQNDGIDVFLKNIIDNANAKMKTKHRMLCEGMESNLQELCSSGLWEALKPKAVNCSDLSDYHYTEMVMV